MSVFPDKFEPYKAHIPEEERGDMILAYYKRLTSPDGAVRRAAAREWTLWEMGTSKLLPDTKYMDKADNLDFAAAFARIECHYFVNGIFLPEGFILQNAEKLANIPLDSSKFCLNGLIGLAKTRAIYIEQQFIII